MNRFFKPTEVLLGLVLGLALVSGLASARLPAPSEEAKAQAAQATTKSAWSDKVALYKTCLAMDRTADIYRRDLKAAGKNVPTPIPTPPCTDPGPYVAPVAARPLEASEAHSPPETSAGPPSTSTPAAASAK